MLSFVEALLTESQIHSVRSVIMAIASRPPRQSAAIPRLLPRLFEAFNILAQIELVVITFRQVRYRICYAIRLRGRRRNDVRVRRAMVRNASLTARVSGKIFAMSGSKSTILVPSAYRAAVTPRTALEKSYSGRMVSSSDLRGRAFLLFFFFILFPFRSSCQPGADDSSPWWPVRVGHNQQAMTV